MLTFRSDDGILHSSSGNRTLSNHRSVIEFFTNVLSISAKSLDRNVCHLRKAGIAPPSKRGFGAVDYNTSTAVDLLTGSILAPSNSKVVETVQALRSGHMTSAHFNPLSSDTAPEDRVRAAFNSVRDIGIHLASRLNVSAVLCVVVDSMRSGQFDKWAIGGEGHVTVDFHGKGRGTIIYFDRQAVNEAAVFSFDVDKESPRPSVERMIRVNDQTLRGLAAALGPLPETAIPPPPY
jgi:hypothetical protein